MAWKLDDRAWAANHALLDTYRPVGHYDVGVVIKREYDDPRNPGQKYTTVWYDMWRFVDGKADEHWDTATINAP